MPKLSQAGPEGVVLNAHTPVWERKRDRASGTRSGRQKESNRAKEESVREATQKEIYREKLWGQDRQTKRERNGVEKERGETQRGGRLRVEQTEREETRSQSVGC